MSISVAVDAMGGDCGIEITVPAAISALKDHSDLDIVFFGDREIIQPELSKHINAKLKQRIQIIHTDEVIRMDDSPSVALRNKRQSSMRLAINSVKDKQTHACVSAGNTGALMAISKFVLKTIKGIERPAICSMMPTTHGHHYALDLGANLESDAHQLVQFAIMGSALVEVLENKDQPTIALMNVGEEEVKGITRIKEAHQLLKASGLNYQGYVEGNALFTSPIDVIVMDGLEGNVALKATEGVVQYIRETITHSIKSSWGLKIVAVLISPLLQSLIKTLSPSQYNGASLLGLQGIVVKSHGSATILGFKRAIDVAYNEAKENIVERTMDVMNRTETPQKAH